jgi:aminoglycoside phosphotransferase (APT) family kinase protein
MPAGGTAVPGTAPVREAHRFDVHALERYLAGRLPGFVGPLEVRQFLGGQSNPTYHLRAPSGDYVLRRKPPGKLLPSAHAVEREFRVIAALRGTGVPVPEAFVLCEDPGVVGTAFYVMRYVAGRVLPELGLPALTPAERRALWDDAVGVLARLHQVDWRAVGLADFGRPGNYYARQLHRWVGQYRASETETIPAMERLIEWLPAHMPADDTTTLVHGDFRIGNTVVHATEPPSWRSWTGSSRRSVIRSATSGTSARRSGCRRESTSSAASISRAWGFPPRRRSWRGTVV